jgi:ParB family chromosome partitioning protein
MPSKLEQQMAEQVARRGGPAAGGAGLGGTVLGTMGREAGAAEMLKLSQLVRSRFQSRGKRDEVYLENLVESIRAEGLLDPIIVRPLPAGTEIAECYTITPPDPALPLYELVAGHHRVDAFGILGRDEIRGFVRHLSDAEAARALTSENTIRKGLGDWELYKHLVMLRKENAVASNVEAARVLNKNRTIVQMLDGFGELPQAVQDLLDDHPNLIGYNLAHKLKSYCPRHANLVFDALVLLSQEKLTQASVPAWIEDKANPRARKPRKDMELGNGVRLVVTSDGARVSGNLDYDRLHKLIETHLSELLVAA